METIFQRVCGLDVHEASIVACVVVAEEGKRRPKKTLKTFSAMHSDIVRLREWLDAQSVTHVVMEGTGIYWRPVYEVLEGGFDLWVVNARHVKNLPGRKSDVIDAEWLATLLGAGLLRKSFVPSAEIRTLRDLTRYRRMLVQTQTSEKNRILKLVETMGVKLAGVASDAFGTSGMAMLRAIAEGTKTTEEIAQMARSALRRKLPELRLALECVIRPEHRMMLRDQLSRLDATTAEIAKYDGIIASNAAPYAECIELLRTIPGINRIAAHEIFAEVGPNLSTFPTARNFAAWVGTAPGMNESAGKNKNARRRRGNPYMTSILIECALGATKKKGGYLKDKYRRLKARRPTLVALFAIANKIAHAVHRVLTERTAYHELGETYLDQRNSTQTAKKLIKRITNLGIDRDILIQMIASAPLQSPKEGASTISSA
jgi:transposase